MTENQNEQLQNGVENQPMGFLDVDYIIDTAGKMAPISPNPDGSGVWGKRDMTFLVGGTPSPIQVDDEHIIIYDSTSVDANKSINGIATFLVAYAGFTDFVIYGNAVYCNVNHYDPKKR